MSKSRNKYFRKLIMLSCTTILCACATTGCEKSGGIVADTGSGKQQTIAKEDYLNLDVLKEDSAGNAEKLYTVYTIERGTYEEQALQQTLSRSFENVSNVYLELDEPECTLASYEVNYMDYVNEGDVVAIVNVKCDPIEIKAAETKLMRLTERYEAAKLDYEKRVQEFKDDWALENDKFEYRIKAVEYDQMLLDWENTEGDFAQQIESAKEKLAKLKSLSEKYEVKANASGYFGLNYWYQPASRLAKNDYICHIMVSNEVYTSTNIQNDLFEYGMKFNINGKSGETDAMVVSAGERSLYGNLDSKRTIMKLGYQPDETALTRNYEGMILRGNMKTIENVLLVPCQAVTVEDGQYYVTVLREDGTLLKTEFIPGGSNSSVYWVYEGLGENTRIVYN